MDTIDSIGSTRVEGSSDDDSEVQRTMLELLNQLEDFESKQNIKKITEMMSEASSAEGVSTEAEIYALREGCVHKTQEDFELAVIKINYY
ncbi:unnamed protein product [Adineta steineri]|uniref:Uncharacterized protein n=1 Tax=Adineta steineri TaxID=433720 RepID=A0A814X360_9BILA|nr:unnamed protein product [Adineta steineri]CAF4051696.1 unnamed protein product [Adineta steineri]